MEKITFVTQENENVDFFVLEQTKLSGNQYILVTDSEEDDGEALILKETENKNGEVTYEIVDDEAELSAVALLFENLLEDVELS